jgi:hypothetical protein
MLIASEVLPYIPLNPLDEKSPIVYCILPFGKYW